MSSQKVKKQERLIIALSVVVPDINRFKSYRDLNRKYKMEIDGKPIVEFDQDTPRKLNITTKLRSIIEVKKVYGSKRPDSVFTYRVGENFAEVTNQVGNKKRIALDFTQNNTLEVEDDISFNNLVNIL